VRVVVGDSVDSGQTLAVLEAMKMHYEIVAEAAGTVKEVMAVPGKQVAADDLLIDIEVEAAVEGAEGE
jgi:biotin carboxyl carrier protein